MNYVYHLLSTPRLPFTGAYFGSIILTLVFALKVCSRSPSLPSVSNLHQLHSTLLTLVAALIQLGCLAWYMVSYFPMGSTGLRMATTFGARQAAAWISG
jgi:hypothetical protein